MPSNAFTAIALIIAVMMSDIYARKVPNTWLLMALIVGASIDFVTWVHDASKPPWPALLGMIAGLIALMPFYALDRMGAGDVKFFAALGFLLGAKALLPIWIIGSLLVGAHIITILLSRYWLSHTVPGWTVAQIWASTSPLGQHLKKARNGRQGLPYAAYLGAGALITIFQPNLMHW